MSAERTTVTLGEVLTPVRVPVTVEDDASYEQVTVSIKGRGLRSRGVVPGSTIKTKRQFRVTTNQLLVSKIDARNGGLGIVPEELDGAVVSGDFPVFEVNNEHCLPAYLDLFVKRSAFWEECLLVSEGSTNRVRLVPEQFLDLEIDLPPMDEQAKIVTCIRLLSGLQAALAREADATVAALEAVREALFGEFGIVAVGELLANIQGGKSPKAADRPPVDGELGVLKVSAIRPGKFRPNEAKALDVDAAMPEHARVRPGDLLVNRASGSRELLCSACLVEGEVDGLYLSDKTLRLIPSEGVDALCLMEALALRVTREQIETEGEGTSGAKNVGQDDIRGLEVPWPADGAEQQRIAERTALFRTAARLARRSGSAVAGMRNALVEELLTGTRTAPRLAA